MTRRHRCWHAWLWLGLGPLLLTAFGLGLAARPTPVNERQHFPGPVGSHPPPRHTPAREVAP